MPQKSKSLISYGIISPQRRRIHALIMLAEPMQERPDTDMTPLSIEFTNPLANDFFQRRLDAVWGLAFRFDSGRKELPSVVIGRACREIAVERNA